MTFHVKDAGVWKEVLAGDGFSVKDAGTWKLVDEGWVKDGGVWKRFYQRSDPQTYYFDASDSDSWRQPSVGGWRSDGDSVYTGSWGFGDHIGVMEFAGLDTTATDTLPNLAAIRPTVVSAKIKLYRQGGHGYSVGAGTIYFGTYTGTIGTGDADDSIDIDPVSTYSTGIARNSFATISLDTALIDEVIAGRELWTANQLSGFSTTGGQDTSYYIFDGWNEGNPPQLEVTLDY